MPAEITEQLKKIKEVTDIKAVNIDISGGQEQLHGAVKSLSARVEDIDSQGLSQLVVLRNVFTDDVILQVDSYLNRSTIPTTPGTFLLSTRSIASLHNYTVRAAMVLRIMRYISHHPWGSLRAEANRKKTHIWQIVQKVWTPDPLTENIKAFTAGGGVLWQPVVVSRTGKIKLVQTLQPGERSAWLVSRQPPPVQNKDLIKVPDPLHLDLTNLVAERLVFAQENGENPRELVTLYDCRFLLRFDLAMMPKDVVDSIVGDFRDGEIHVMPLSRWYFPQIVWRRVGKKDEVLPSYVVHESSYEVVNHLQKRVVELQEEGSSTEGWIRIEWARSIEAI
jgi:tRNA(Ile)-lysidine synthase